MAPQTRSGSTRTTTPCSACRRTRPRKTSRAPTGSWRSSTTPTPTRGTQDAEERFKEISAAQRRARRRREAQGVRPGPRDGRVRGRPGWPGGFGGFGGGGPGGVRERAGRGPRRLSAISSATCSAGAAAGAVARRGPASVPQRGNDIETELHLDFLDAVHGITTSVNITSEAPCHVCNGTGAKPGTSPDSAPPAAARARSRSTRALLVLARCARPAAGAAAWSRTSASTARAAASRSGRGR